MALGDFIFLILLLKVIQLFLELCAALRFVHRSSRIPERRCGNRLCLTNPLINVAPSFFLFFLAYGLPGLARRANLKSGLVFH
jgi:hypothetical protein